MRNQESGKVTSTAFTPADTRRGNEVTVAFQKAGGTYYLDSVSAPTHRTAYRVPPSRKLQETAQVETPERILIAAR